MKDKSWNFSGDIMTPEVERTIREIISMIPSLEDRVYLLVLMANHPAEMQWFATKIVRSLKK